MRAVPSIKNNLAINTAYQILNMIVPFISTPYVSRVLGAEGVGIYSFTNSIATYFAMFAALGTMSYGARGIARARDDKRKMSQLFWEIEALVVISTLVCVLIWGSWTIFAPEYNKFYLILTLVIVNTIADISWFFTGIEQFKYIVVRNTIVKITGLVLLFVFIKDVTDLTLYVFIMTSTTLIGSISMWLYLPKMVCKVSWSSIRLKRHFKETLIYLLPAVATSIYTILNKVLLGFMGEDIRENGYFEQTTKVISMAQALTFYALNNVMGARISYLFRENKIKEIHQRINMSLHYILFMGLGITFGLIAVAPRFVPWFFGPDFIEATMLLQLLCPIILIISISNCLETHYYIPAGLRKKSAQYLIVGAVVNLLFNVILIPYYGAIGAAIGSLIAEGAITVLFLWNCDRFLSTGQIIKNGWKKCISASVMLIIVHYAVINIYNSTIAIFSSVVIGAITYVLMLLTLKDDFIIEAQKAAFKFLAKK